MIKQWVGFNHFLPPTAFLLVMSLQGIGLKAEFMGQLSLQKRFPRLASCPIVLMQEKAAAQIQFIGWRRRELVSCPPGAFPCPLCLLQPPHIPAPQSIWLQHRAQAPLRVQVWPRDRSSGFQMIWEGCPLPPTQTTPRLEFHRNIILSLAKHSSSYKWQILLRMEKHQATLLMWIFMVKGHFQWLDFDGLCTFCSPCGPWSAASHPCPHLQPLL